MFNNSNATQTVKHADAAPTAHPTALQAGAQSLQACDLLRPFPARRGVRPHAADLLSRMQRRSTYLPV